MQWFYLERLFYHYVTTHFIVHHFIVCSALFLKARCHTIETLSLVLFGFCHSQLLHIQGTLYSTQKTRYIVTKVTVGFVTCIFSHFYVNNARRKLLNSVKLRKVRAITPFKVIQIRYIWLPLLR